MTSSVHNRSFQTPMDGWAAAVFQSSEWSEQDPKTLMLMEAKPELSIGICETSRGSLHKLAIFQGCLFSGGIYTMRTWQKIYLSVHSTKNNCLNLIINFDMIVVIQRKNNS